MTDEEKREMAAVDSRLRAMLERTEGLTPAARDRLHGTLRYPHRPTSPMVRATGGSALKVGTLVRLRPKSGGDIFDIVLKDQIAIVEAVERDFEDREHVAVTLLDDPGRDMGMQRMPGHRFFFAPSEVEVLDRGVGR
jgi:hydrogenase maturation protease